MSANHLINDLMKRTPLDRIVGRRQKGARKRAAAKNGGRCSLQMESLERREMFSVSSVAFNDHTVVVKTDNAATSVRVSKVGSEIRISELGTNKHWDYK